MNIFTTSQEYHIGCSCCVADLCQQQPLRLQFQLDSVSLVVQELLQLEVLESTQGAVISPVNSYLHFPGLSTENNKKISLLKLHLICALSRFYYIYEIRLQIKPDVHR